MSRKITLGPVNRVEGDLEIRLTLANEHIADAQVQSTLFRGFENLLTGKVPMDALAITPRICGICSVSQSVAAAKAIANFAQITPAANGELVTNVLLATEIVADLLTHFNLFFMPDFCHPAYQNKPWYKTVANQYTAVSGQRHGQMLKARAEFLHIMGILAGKWPHSMVFQPGGVSKVVNLSEQLKLTGIVNNFRQYLEQYVFGDKLDNILAISNHEQLQRWYQQQTPFSADLTTFLALSETLSLENIGASQNNLLAFATLNNQNEWQTVGGTVLDHQTLPINLQHIDEHLMHSKLTGNHAHPAQGITQPDLNKPMAYTWAKAPRYDHHVMETGAIARQVMANQPLAKDLYQRSQTNIHNRIVLRLFEMAHLTHAIEHWLMAIKPQKTFCHHQALPKEGMGVGLTEAARGALGHWLTVENGRISNYQLITPTSWNFSPKDNLGNPGPLEFALAGRPYANQTDKQMMQHIIRSFDPCMLCTVH